MSKTQNTHVGQPGRGENLKVRPLSQAIINAIHASNQRWQYERMQEQMDKRMADIQQQLVAQAADAETGAVSEGTTSAEAMFDQAVIDAGVAFDTNDNSVNVDIEPTDVPPTVEYEMGETDPIAIIPPIIEPTKRHRFVDENGVTKELSNGAWVIVTAEELEAEELLNQQPVSVLTGTNTGDQVVQPSNEDEVSAIQLGDSIELSGDVLDDVVELEHLLDSDAQEGTSIHLIDPVEVAAELAGRIHTDAMDVAAEHNQSRAVDFESDN